MLRPPLTSTLFPYTTLFRSATRATCSTSTRIDCPRWTCSRRSPVSCPDRKSTRLNSSHRCISYAVFCLKKKNKNQHNQETKYNITRERQDDQKPHNAAVLSS